MAIWMIYPETMGLDLEDVGELLKDGWGVKESLRKVKERRKVTSGENGTDQRTRYSTVRNTDPL